MDVTRQELALQLARIEASAGFRRAESLTRFLRYVTDQALAGRPETLKEYTIAQEVFGRPPSYDPQVDSLVRVQASLLRTRLEQYYSTDGREDPVRIEIPKGGYEPVFRRVGAPAGRRLHRAVVGGVLVSIALAVGAWVWAGKRHPPSYASSLSRPEAIQHYKTGIYWRISPTVDNLRKAAGEFSAAIAADSSYAPAQAGLAEAYGRLYYAEAVSAEESVVPARAAAAKALALDDRLAQAHEAAALIHLIDWDFVGAEREYKRAIELDPSHVRTRFAYAQLCLNPEGRYKDAIGQLQKALEVDPVSMNLITELGVSYRLSGDEARAREQFRRSIDLNPNAAGARTNLAITDMMAGHVAEGVRRLEAIDAASPGDAWIMGHLGYGYAKLGRAADARRVLEAMKGKSSAALHIAAVHAGLEEVEAALDVLERGAAAKSPSVLWLKSDFRFEKSRGYARYKSLVAQLP